MLISVAGSTGLGQVAGVSGSSPAALLKVVAQQPDQQVLVLVPRHATAAARRQAELLSTARPLARVELLISHHHALTLTVVAHQILGPAPWTGGIGELVEAVQARLVTARSLVWGPSVWRLGGTGAGLGTRLRCLIGRQDPVVELSDSSPTGPAREGWCLRPGDQVFGSHPVPALLLEQLDGHRPIPLATEIEPTASYRSRSAHLFTVVPSVPARSQSSHESEAA